MLCREIMKRDVRCVSSQATVVEAAALMRDENIGFVPVCDEDGTVIGALTDRDIAVRVVAEGESPQESVERFMSREIVACRSDEDLSVAQDLMGEMQVSRMICLDDSGRLVGVISLSDIAQLGEGSEIATTLRNVTVREARA
jgi:CBS domain-containing protein